MIDIYQLSLVDILPESLKQDPVIVAMAKALDPEFKAVSAAIKETILLALIDELPSEVVDLLAWQRHVDFYGPSLPLEKRRDLVKNSPEFHTRKGTPYAIEGVAAAAFDDSQVLEWFDYSGDPGYFKVITTDRVTDDSKLKLIFRAIDSVKRRSQWLESITIQRDNQLPTYVGAGSSRIKMITIQPAEVN